MEWLVALLKAGFSNEARFPTPKLSVAPLRSALATLSSSLREQLFETLIRSLRSCDGGGGAYRAKYSGELINFELRHQIKLLQSALSFAMH